MGRYGDADKTKLAKKRHDEGARKSTAIIKPYQAFNRGAEFQIEASRSAGFSPDLPHSPYQCQTPRLIELHWTGCTG